MSDDVGGLWLLTLGPAGGAALYWATNRHYRSTGEAHFLQRETEVNAKPVVGSGRKAHWLKRTREPRMRGENGRRIGNGLGASTKSGSTRI